MDKKLRSKVINNKNILVAVTILTLVAFNVVQFFINQRSEQLTKEKYESKQLELVNTYAKLDTISIQLDERIEHIKRLGGSVDSLIEIKSQLERDKYALKQVNHIAADRYEQIKGKLEGYERLLAMKDEEIAKKELVASELVTERKALLEKQDELSERLDRLETEKNKLIEQMNAAAKLDAKNIRFYSINARGIAEEEEEFRAEKLERLKVSVNISGNQLAKKGKKQVMMRVIEPEGASLFNTNSGTFNYKGKEIFYTSATEFYFDNSDQQVDFTYLKGNSYTKGEHKVEFYCEGNKIGEGSFEVK